MAMCFSDLATHKSQRSIQIIVFPIANPVGHDAQTSHSLPSLVLEIISWFFTPTSRYSTALFLSVGAILWRKSNFTPLLSTL